MTKAQKIIATMGLALMFGRFLSAPWRFEGYDPLHRARTGEERLVSGRVHAPLWAPPDHEELLAKARVRTRNSELQLERVSGQLDSIRFAAWLAAIATITVLAIGAPSSRGKGPRHGPIE